MKKVFILVCMILTISCMADVFTTKRLPTNDNFKMPKVLKYIDVYEVGRFDFDDEFSKEQIVIDSGGGSGGPMWHIRRLNGIKISNELFGELYIAEKVNGYYQLIVVSQSGVHHRDIKFLRFENEKYVCYREEHIDYSANKVVIKNYPYDNFCDLTKNLYKKYSSKLKLVEDENNFKKQIQQMWKGEDIEIIKESVAYDDIGGSGTQPYFAALLKRKNGDETEYYLISLCLDDDNCEMFFIGNYIQIIKSYPLDGYVYVKYKDYQDNEILTGIQAGDITTDYQGTDKRY